MALGFGATFVASWAGFGSSPPQARTIGARAYRVLSTEGPSHLPRFVVEVCVGNEVLATGEGASKRQAERAAAEKALAAKDGQELNDGKGATKGS